MSFDIQLHQVEPTEDRLRQELYESLSMALDLLASQKMDEISVCSTLSTYLEKIGSCRSTNDSLSFDVVKKLVKTSAQFSENSVISNLVYELLKSAELASLQVEELLAKEVPISSLTRQLLFSDILSTNSESKLVLEQQELRSYLLQELSRNPQYLFNNFLFIKEQAKRLIFAHELFSPNKQDIVWEQPVLSASSDLFDETVLPEFIKVLPDLDRRQVATHVVRFDSESADLNKVDPKSSDLLFLSKLFFWLYEKDGSEESQKMLSQLRLIIGSWPRPLNLIRGIFDENGWFAEKFYERTSFGEENNDAFHFNSGEKILNPNTLFLIRQLIEEMSGSEDYFADDQLIAFQALDRLSPQFIFGAFCRRLKSPESRILILKLLEDEDFMAIVNPELLERSYQISISEGGLTQPVSVESSFSLPKSLEDSYLQGKLDECRRLISLSTPYELLKAYEEVRHVRVPGQLITLQGLIEARLYLTNEFPRELTDALVDRIVSGKFSEGMIDFYAQMLREKTLSQENSRILWDFVLKNPKTLSIEGLCWTLNKGNRLPFCGNSPSIDERIIELFDKEWLIENFSRVDKSALAYALSNKQNLSKELLIKLSSFLNKPPGNSKETHLATNVAYLLEKIQNLPIEVFDDVMLAAESTITNDSTFFVKLLLILSKAQLGESNFSDRLVELIEKIFDKKETRLEEAKLLVEALSNLLKGNGLNLEGVKKIFSTILIEKDGSRSSWHDYGEEVVDLVVGYCKRNNCFDDFKDLFHLVLNKSGFEVKFVLFKLLFFNQAHSVVDFSSLSNIDMSLIYGILTINPDSCSDVLFDKVWKIDKTLPKSGMIDDILNAFADRHLPLSKDMVNCLFDIQNEINKKIASGIHQEAFYGRRNWLLIRTISLHAHESLVSHKFEGTENYRLAVLNSPKKLLT